MYWGDDGSGAGDWGPPMVNVLIVLKLHLLRLVFPTHIPFALVLLHQLFCDGDLVVVVVGCHGDHFLQYDVTARWQMHHIQVEVAEESVVFIFVVYKC